MTRISGLSARMSGSRAGWEPSIERKSSIAFRTAQSPTVQIKYLKKATLYGLKKVLHAYARASQARRQFDAYLVETRRPDPDNGVPRKAEPFTRNSQERIQLVIGILIVKNGKRVTAGRNVPKLDMASVGLDRLLQRQRVLFAIRKVFWVARKAGMDRAAMVSKPAKVHFDRSSWSGCGQQRNGKEGGGKSSHRPTAYQQLCDVAKPAAV